ncbi:hypothetical protein BDR07DRAFT_1378409 [Suillus spraguei]|nr:hypothetical protein BDR07DRAFT_1378409 [Suillus spraguei]
MSFDAINADAFCWAGDKIEHIPIVVEMAHALSRVFSIYALQAISVPPMVLSAAAELHEHLDSSFCKVKIPTARPALWPSKGKGKEKAVPVEDTSDDHGHQLEHGKHAQLHAMSTRSQSTTPQPKCQCAKSKFKAISLVMMTWNWTMWQWQCLSQCRHQQSLSKWQGCQSSQWSSKDSHANSTLPVWLPGCGTCVQQQLIFRQGYNSSHEQLGVCARSHRTKHKCSSKGSAAPTKSRRPAVRSKSCHRASTVHVTYKELDKEDELVVRTKIDGEA